jgi:Zn finger protein HypA/HybF involved in hydrogenase expression
MKFLEGGNEEKLSNTIGKWLKREQRCWKCGWNEIHPVLNKVPLEINHIDGNSKNNHKDNLEVLCPNCHSLTPNYRALNYGNGRTARYKRGLVA